MTAGVTGTARPTAERVRYIGNKTRLLPFLRKAMRRFGIAPGVAHDAFAGTAAVGRALKEDGWRVASSDLMTYSYVFQRAYVVAQRVPSFADLRAAEPELRRALRSPNFRSDLAAAGSGALSAVALYLSRWLEAEPGFMAQHFAPGRASGAGRMYFTAENAARIDTVRRCLHDWHVGGLIDDDAFYLLLAALIEGADRVANTAGVYAAYIKRWQPNARKPLMLVPLAPVRGARGSTARRDDAVRAARELGAIDLLYVDPPYNARQYAGYYHVPELIARGWFNAPPVLSGKTGLLSRGEQVSDWCSPRRVEGALRELIASTGARQVLVSYNSEGLLADRVLGDVLASALVDGRVGRARNAYRRYRADRDHAGRRYRADGVVELVYHARLR